MPCICSQCADIENQLNVLILQLQTDKNTCEKNYDYIDKLNTQCNNVIYEKDAKIFELEKVIEGSIKPRPCPPVNPPAPPCKCTGDPEETKVCKSELTTCQSNLYLMGGRYDQCIKDCTPGGGTGKPPSSGTGNPKCLESLNQCKDDLSNKTTELQKCLYNNTEPTPSKCKKDLQTCKSSLKAEEDKFDVCEATLQNCVVTRPAPTSTNRPGGDDCTFETLKWENKYTQCQTDFDDLHLLYKECEEDKKCTTVIPGKADCVKFTNPLQYTIIQWQNKYQECQKSQGSLELKISECSRTIINYNVSLASCLDKCPTKECPGPQPTPSACDKNLGIVNQKLSVCDRDLAQYLQWYQELLIKLGIAEGDIEYYKSTLNMMNKNYYDCDAKYKALWSSCVIGSQTKCPQVDCKGGNVTSLMPGGGFDGNSVTSFYTDIYVQTFFGDLKKCNWEVEDLKRKAEKCEKGSQSAKKFVTNMGSEWKLTNF